MPIHLPERAVHFPVELFPDLEIIAQIYSDEQSKGNPVSYIEVYEKHHKCDDERCRDDKWRVVWKNDQTLEVYDYNERDLVDTISVLSQALSVINNRKP